MAITYVPEIGAENRYQKTGTIKRHENIALSYSLPETGTWKIQYETACQTLQKPVPIVWYLYSALISGSLRVSLASS